MQTKRRPLPPLPAEVCVKKKPLTNGTGQNDHIFDRC